MLTETTSSKAIKTRTLKKVRAQFLHKKENSDDPVHVDSDTRYLGNTLCVLDQNLGLVEVNRKISLGPQNLNLFFKISDFQIKSQSSNRVYKVNFAIDKNCSPVPWDYTLKRLESYGDLDLATLAHRIDKFRKGISRIITEFGDSIRRDDIMAKKLWEDMVIKADKTCEEIEKSPIFYKIVFHTTKDSDQTVSNSYSEGLLKEMGYLPENFFEWAEKNGMPTMFGPDSMIYQAAAKSFLDFAMYSGNTVYVSPQYETFLCRYKEPKKKILARTVGVLKPVADGFLSIYYFVCENIDSEKTERNKHCLALENKISIGDDSCVMDSEQHDKEISSQIQKLEVNEECGSDDLEF